MSATAAPRTQPLPLLHGERLQLRAYRNDDIDALFAIYSDPTVMRYWSYPPWTDRAQAEAYLARDREAAGDSVLAWRLRATATTR